MNEPCSPERLSQQLNIRRFAQKDAKAIWQVSTSALEPLGISPIRGPQHKDFDNIMEAFFAKNGEFLVAEVDGQVVAMGGFLESERDPQTAVIRRMRTLPRYQGQGIGKRILTELESGIKAHGYKKIRLGTSTIMPHAVTLYESMGYKEVERKFKPDAGFGSDFAEIIYEKDVPVDTPKEP